MKTRSLLIPVTLAAVALWFLAADPVRADLIHRYSFTSDAKDSVGTANGTLQGIGAGFDGAGQVVLPGGSASSDPVGTLTGYVDLPNHIFNVLTNATLQTWVTWTGSGSWQRVFDFGTSDGGEDVSNGNGNYLFLSPQGPDNIRFAVRDPVTGTELVQLTSTAPLETGTEACLTVTYDHIGNVSRLYSNTVMLVEGPASIPLTSINDVNNWLGRSQWGDPMFAGSFNEFRVYDNALNPLEVAASSLSGPATPATDIALLGALQAVHLNVQKTNLTEADILSASATADYAKATGLRLESVPGVVFHSDNTNAITISAAGQVTAVAAGTANVSVSFSGSTNVIPMTVSPRVTGIAIEGTLYVDLHATDVKTDASTWPNKAGKGDFIATGTPTYTADVAGTGIAGVTFNGTTDAYQGPNTTEDIDQNGDSSIEVWAFNPDIGQEETLVAWGHRGGPNRSNMSFNYGANGSYGAVGHWGEDMGWNGAPPAGQWHYLVYTYDGVLTARAYSDGVVKSTRDYPGGLTIWGGLPIRIGAQGNTAGDDFDLGQALSGSIAVVRVHGGQLTANDVAHNFLLGVEGTDPGTLNGISMSLGSTNLVGPGAATITDVSADYANRKYLKVGGLSTFKSSDTNILTVDASGAVSAVALGSATITATYQGKQASQSVTVVPLPPAVLIHRYSFSEAAGSTTVKDSVGTANGTLQGDTTLGGGFTGSGALSLPGGASGSGAPYVDLPNGLISSLTNISLEAWVTWKGAGPDSDTWQRIFDFGDNSGGEDAQGTGQTYLFLTPRASSGLVRFAATATSNGGETPVLDGASALTIGQESHVAVSYDVTGQAARLYVNGKKAASGTATVALKQINDINVWLGRSQWGDPYFYGDFNEFRVWNGAMADAQVAANFAAGPDALPSAQSQVSVSIALAAQNLVLAWLGDAAGFSVESSPALGSQAKWTKVGATPVVVGSQNQATIPIPGTTTFYRLTK